MFYLYYRTNEQKKQTFLTKKVKIFKNKKSPFDQDFLINSIPIYYIYKI